MANFGPIQLSPNDDVRVRTPAALLQWEFAGRALVLPSLGVSEFRRHGMHQVRIPEIGFCEEKNRLLGEFLAAIRELNALLSQQTQAVIDGDPDFSRLDLRLHLAQEKKEQAKYRWIAHVETHHCEEG
jgi:hypothetical protein